MKVQESQKFLWLIIGLLCPIVLSAQTDTEFWFAAPEISYEFAAPSPIAATGMDRPIALHLSTFESSATVTVDQPANPAFVPIVQTVLPGNSTTINLTPYIDMIENKPANTILNYGIRIRSTKPITAFYGLDCLQNSAVYTLLGKNAFGQNFLIPSQFAYDNYPYASPDARNSFDIVALKNNTTVTIVPAKPILGHAAGDTFSIVLNRGQTWEGRAVSGSASQHLGGTFLWSDKPIAVTISDDAVYVPISDVSVDAAGDQLIPVELLDTAYFHAGGASSNPTYNRVYIYALENATTIDTNGSFAAMLNRGEYFEHWRNYANGSVLGCGYVRSDKPVLVYNFSGRCNPVFAQTGASVISPSKCSGTRKVAMTHNSIISGSQYYFTMITKEGNQGAFTITGVPPIIILPLYFQPVPGTSGSWVESSWTCSDGTWPPGLTRILSNTAGSFMVGTAYGDLQNSSQVAYITDVSALNLGPDISICAGDSVVLDAGYGKLSYLWSTGSTSQTITVKNDGIYWVTVQDVNCTLTDTIQVSYWQVTPVSLGNDRLLCQGDSVLLNAGPGYFTYLWSTGATSQTIWAKQPGNYWVRAQQYDCFVYDTVMVTLVQGINAGPDRSMCPGDSVLIDAGPGMTTYLWNTGAITQSIWGTTAGTFSVTATAQSCTFRDSVVVSYLPYPVVNLGPDTVLCAGQSILFDAGSCTGCTYQWANLTTGQMNIGTGQTYTATTEGIYRATVTGPNGCKGRDTVTVTLGQPVIIGINIAASSTEVCEGTPVTFTATAVNGGSNPIYRWKVNGANQFTGSPVYTFIPANGDVITCELTSSLTSCISVNPVTSNAITMAVNPILTVSVSVTASANPVCQGEPVTFTGAAMHGGSTPLWQWLVNGSIVFTGSPVYTYTPNDGDIVIVHCQSSIVNCISNNPATSTPVIMTVNPNLTVSVTVTPSSNPFCLGEPVTFTAVAINGGPTPFYQWFVNGANLFTGSPVYTYFPTNGDQIIVNCTSSIVNCISNNPATSTPVTMVVNTSLPAGVTIAASNNPFCPGTTVTFTATPLNGGSSPTYQWLINGANHFTGSPVLSFSPQSGDSIRCIMTSNLSCVTGNPAGSNKIIMAEKNKPTVTFTPCFDTITTVNAKPIRIKGGLPLGGTYSGPGVNSTTGLFTPSTAGPGTHQITYTYQNTYGCEATKQSLIHSFTHSLIPCGSPFTDIRDGKTYPTVQIGTQCWFQKNLEYGLTIPDNIPQTDNCIPEKYNCQLSIVNCQLSVYQWDELMQYQTAEGSQGLCPPGWHVPTESDWTVLFNFYQGASRAGRPLQDTVINGFKALMSGVFYSQSFLNYQDFATILWSSTPSGSDRALAHGMNIWNYSVSLYPALRSNGFGVRCVRDP